ncbi:MAG: YfhO family protein, partial [Chloroflexi bacterium]|nr:YfhO family protein [Chloroflexota bacterium]
ASLPRPGFVVFPEASYPGWRATVDGQPAEIVRANLLFQAVYVPEGRHRVTFEFTSPMLALGGAITRSALAWTTAVLAVWGIWRWWRRRRAGRRERTET